ncbi:hypothetical protein AWB78_01044 [Caballeronia calidae]|uniref:DUF5666 domain-containing protein n=1 Tax=Caballeronia calidae TaxID=1777139 RepID=A0A157ZWP8_9BURK|nr:hypothetical protein [Caballeronia calidae]SAK49958.1 hypothetical protein AWB78_01044 [Caballeronia calidae]
MNVKPLLAAVVVLTMASPALSQPQTSVEVTKGTGKAAVVGTTKFTATIVAIDPATRTVTLKDKRGKVVELEVGEEARNFDQLKVGDVVATEYKEAMSLSLSKTSGPRSASQRQIEQRAAPGAKPGGTIGREITIMADVVNVDAKAQTVTLKGPQGNKVDVIVEDPAQLKNIHKGDQVEVVYTEALAISVTPGATQ